MTHHELTARHQELAAQIAAVSPEYGSEVHSQAAWALCHYPRMSDARSWLYALGDREGPIGLIAPKASVALAKFELSLSKREAA